jgi:hypothetical protein
MKIRYYLIGLAFVVLCGAAIGYYMYTKPSPKAADLKADFSLKAEDLTVSFQTDAQKANLNYSGKVIEVMGKLAEIKTDEKGLVTLVLDGSPGTTVSCIFEKPLTETLNKGDVISLKGFCAGWDDLFSEVKLHSGSLAKK